MVARIARAGGWTILIVVSAVMIFRAVGPTSRTWEIRILVISPLIVFPTVVVLVAAAVFRRWFLGSAGALLVILQLIWLVPTDHPWATAPTAKPGASLRLFDANISQSNRQIPLLAAQLRTARPDLVAFEELTPAALAALRASRVLDGYPYRVVKPIVGAGGVGLWSRRPLSHVELWDNLARQYEIEARVGFARGTLTVDVVHVFAPVGAGQPRFWRQQLGRIRSHVVAQPRPVVVAGDFNATEDLPQFRSFLHTHLRDAAVLRGEGWRMTWPDDQHVPPYLRLDHVLLSTGLTATGYHVEGYAGSDHRALVADVAPAS